MILFALLSCTQPDPPQHGDPEPVVEPVELPALDVSRAAELAALSLHCVDREYPNKPAHIPESDADILPPRVLHPSFYGCFDWHSSVHGHWTLARLTRTFPDMPGATEARAVLGAHLAPDPLEVERAYLEAHPLFERPYGWGWLLRLQAELDAWDDPDARRWAAALRPVSVQVSTQLQAYLDVLSVPVRAGTHHSTAYALAHAWDYAAVTGDRALATAIEGAARRFYLDDRDCPVDWEPSGEDFLSPCLAEAALMVRVLPDVERRRWLEAFLPADLGPLAAPPEVLDRHDPRLGHLIGLSLHRATCYRELAAEGDYQALAAVHLEHGLREMVDSGYGGAHWLASFAVVALTVE